MDRLEDRMCKKHDRLLELFCKTEQVCVCQSCTEGDHRSHPVVPLKEEYEVKMAQLGKIEAEVQRMIQERQNNIQEIKDAVKRSKADADREIADGVKVLTALMRCIEKWQDDLNQMVKERLKSTEKQAEDLIKELEQEIEDLTNRGSEVKQLSQTKEYLHFLQAFRSLKDPPPTRDRTTVEVRPPSYVGTLRRSLDQLEETLNMEMKKLRDDVELKRVQQYEVDVTLDPDTAHPNLILSEDGKQVHDGGNPAVRLPQRAELQKVGVFVDYDEGLVSFYDVEARVHLYSATDCSFRGPLYPLLSPWSTVDGAELQLSDDDSNKGREAPLDLSLCPEAPLYLSLCPEAPLRQQMYGELAAQFRTNVEVKEQPCVESSEVPCDVCTGTQLKAVKSCLVCLVSYCQTHLEPHQRVTVMKKHRLVEPMDRLEDRVCKKHDRLLELFCKTEEVGVCQSCTEGDHRSHPVVPLKEEYEVKMAQLGKMEAEVQQMIQERQNNILEIKDTVKRSKADADREIADGVQVLTALMRCIQKCQDDLNQMVKERLKSTEKQAEDLIKELEQEIEDLTNRSSEVKQLSYTKDHLHFLQAFRSLKDPPPTRDRTTVEVRPPSYVGTLRSSLDQLEETLNMEMKKMRDVELKRVQQYEVDVTLDPDTAHPRLILSGDGKQVHDGGVAKKLPDNPKRFTYYICVLTRQSFSSGRFYFEVQVEDKTVWYIGVARESINRKGFTPRTPETGYCTLYYDKDGLVFKGNLDVCLPLRYELQKVGVFVDYDEGLVSFYDVEARVHLYSATGCTFREPLYPFLSTGFPWAVQNSAPLIISPVNQTD
ncbi:unnamed protein product [Gadus morhua 'NCC']